jgi:hypothetical protein
MPMCIGIGTSTFPCAQGPVNEGLEFRFRFRIEDLGTRRRHVSHMMFTAWRATVPHVVDHVASTKLYAVDDMASTGTLCGG